LRYKIIKNVTSLEIIIMVSNKNIALQLSQPNYIRGLPEPLKMGIISWLLA
jgi:hypothetical protein